jgi:hypothetical protein
MATDERHTVEALFAGKPHALALFEELKRHIIAGGDVEIVVTRTQVSFGARRKFAWVWLAPPTKTQPEGVLMLTLDMTHRTADPLISSAEETYAGKWAHQIPVRDEAVLERIVSSGWLRDAWEFGSLVRGQKGAR